MRFYNVDMKGKFFVQRGTSNPASAPSEEGRLFYNETDEILRIHDSSGWDAIVTASNAPLVIGADFLRKDGPDTTTYQLGVGSLLSAGGIAGTTLTITTPTATVNGAQVWTSGNDGPGSNLNADLLDSQQGTYYRNASNMNAGILPVARLSGTYNININGTAEYA